MFNVPAQSFFGSSVSRKNFSGNESTKGWTNQSKLTTSKVSETFSASNLFKFLQNNNISTYYNCIGGIPFTNKVEPFEQFFINIIVNHDVLIEENSNNEISFQGPSPDEITLVTAAYEFGFCFKSREKGIITIEIYDHEQNIHKREKKFKILQKFDFTSERQCSSIVVEDLQTKRIILYIKGSDKKIFNILDNYSKQNISQKTKTHLDHFAKQGLRTLCFGLRYLSKDDYYYWENIYKELKHKSMENKAYLKDLENIVKHLESNITLLGVSALEDKLQDEVEKDIKKFIDAGINFWMIT
jgi:magnesium-transporting ATPase (P-type)